MRSKEDYPFLMASIFHELRNPVALLDSYAQLLAARYPQVRSYAYWEKIEQELEHLKILLEDLSAWQKEPALRLCPVSPGEWFARYRERLCEAFRNTNRKPLLILQTDDPLPVIQADPDKLEMLMDNLVRNSMEAVKEASLCLTVRLFSGPDTLFISVKDNGPGIPLQQWESVFEPFVTSKNGGTGLGLPICQKIAVSHGGAIRYGVLPDGGEGFLIRLPAENRPESRPDAHNCPHPHP